MKNVFDLKICQIKNIFHKLIFDLKICQIGQKLGLVDSELDSRSKGCGFESYTRWKWCQSYARSIKVYPILVHSIIEKKKFENTGSQMGHTKKIFKKLSLFTCEKKDLSDWT